MNPSPDETATADPAVLQRFTLGERRLHRSVGILTGVLLLTAAALYVPDVSARVGNRQLVRVLHEAAGFALPIPILLAVASRAFRDDAGRLNRFRPADWQWLRSRDRRGGRIRVGKFNAGQKLNAAFTLGAIIVMLMTGALMFFSSHFPDDLRTGATFVHDWLAVAIAVVVAGHAYMAFNDATARLGMRTGSVPIEWAEREHAAWAHELTTPAGGPTPDDFTPDASSVVAGDTPSAATTTDEASEGR